MSDEQTFEDFEPDYQPDHEGVIVYPSEKRKRKARRGCSGCGCRLGCLAIPLAIVACAAFVGGLVYYLLFPTYETTRDFVGALSNNDYVTAYELTSQSYQQQLGGPDGLRSYVDKELNNLDLAPWSILSFRSLNVENSIGTFTGRLELANGGKVTLRLSLMKEGGEWKIYSFDFSDLSNP